MVKKWEMLDSAGVNLLDVIVELSQREKVVLQGRLPPEPKFRFKLIVLKTTSFTRK